MAINRNMHPAWRHIVLLAMNRAAISINWNVNTKNSNSMSIETIIGNRKYPRAPTTINTKCRQNKAIKRCHINRGNSNLHSVALVENVNEAPIVIISTTLVENLLHIIDHCNAAQVTINQTIHSPFYVSAHLITICIPLQNCRERVRVVAMAFPNIVITVTITLRPNFVLLLVPSIKLSVCLLTIISIIISTINCSQPPTFKLIETTFLSANLPTHELATRENLFSNIKTIIFLLFLQFTVVVEV